MKLGFCGTGLMGTPMVQRLLAAGHAVKVWNRTAAKARPLVALGAQLVDQPVQAATDVDGVLLCLFDSAAVDAVTFGPHGIAEAPGLPWLVDHSSISPDATRMLAQRLHAASGADWLDAPVSGGVAGAQAGTLAAMVGGAQVHLPQATQAIRAYAANITHMGPSGAGQATKLCNQTIVATTVVAVAEALALAQRNGIDIHRLATALAGGWADSKPLQAMLPRMIAPPAESIVALATMLKDIDNVMALAQHSATPMPITAGVQQALRMAAAWGLKDADLSAVVATVWPEQLGRFRQPKAEGASQ